VCSNRNPETGGAAANLDYYLNQCVPSFSGDPGLATSTAIAVGIPPPGISRTISREGSKDAEGFGRRVVHTSAHFRLGSPQEATLGAICAKKMGFWYPATHFPFPTWVHPREGVPGLE
jgi:hypothetical protein